MFSSAMVTGGECFFGQSPCFQGEKCQSCCKQPGGLRVFKKIRSKQKLGAFFRVGFWQNGFFADFYFWAAGFFRGFSPRIFFFSFLWEKCPEKSSRKIPGKILQNLCNKSPRHISAEGPAQFFDFCNTCNEKSSDL